MLNLAFSENGLEVQRKVVVEEFKQSYLNQPYGDVWLKLKPLAYHTHPYQWNTIGKEISHIENAVMDDVRGFFQKHYAPQNAILVVAGAVSVGRSAAAWPKSGLAPFPAARAYQRQLPAEPAQTASPPPDHRRPRAAERPLQSLPHARPRRRAATTPWTC